MSNIIQLTKKGKQMAHNVKQNLSIPLIQSKQEDSELAIRYEKRVHRLIGINMTLFSIFLIFWKYWFQYRLNYTYNQSLDYIYDGFPFIEITLISAIISLAVSILFTYFACHIKDIKCVSIKIYSFMYWLASISTIFFFTFVLSIISTKILIITAVITLCIVMTIKYIAPYVYEKYGYSFTYFQLAMYFQIISTLLLIIFNEGITEIIANIVCIIVDIVILMVLYQKLEYDKTQFNSGEYTKKDIIIYSYESSYFISLNIMDLFVDIAYLLSGDSKSGG